MNMTNDNPKDTLEIDVNAIPLDELIIAIGGVLFSGAELITERSKPKRTWYGYANR